MDYSVFLGWFNDLIIGFSKAGTWLITPISDYEPFAITPLALISFTGLTAFIVVAIVKWVVS